jgi:hypothetical protein
MKRPPLFAIFSRAVEAPKDLSGAEPDLSICERFALLFLEGMPPAATFRHLIHQQFISRVRSSWEVKTVILDAVLEEVE